MSEKKGPSTILITSRSFGWNTLAARFLAENLNIFGIYSRLPKGVKNPENFRDREILILNLEKYAQLPGLTL